MFGEFIQPMYNISPILRTFFFHVPNCIVAFYVVASHQNICVMEKKIWPRITKRYLYISVTWVLMLEYVFVPLSFNCLKVLMTDKVFDCSLLVLDLKSWWGLLSRLSSYCFNWSHLWTALSSLYLFLLWLNIIFSVSLLKWKANTGDGCDAVTSSLWWYSGHWCPYLVWHHWHHYYLPV